MSADASRSTEFLSPRELIATIHNPVDAECTNCKNYAHSTTKKGVTVAAYFQSPKGISKTLVADAGKALAKGECPEDLYKVAQKWRDAHAYVLNTFQCTLRRWVGENKNINIVQRLKRMSTIQDKLATGRSKNLASMQDLAGCRLIFESLEDLYEFRRAFHTSRAQHERINGSKYDYIASPKKTGYRGIHDVYEYMVSDEPGSQWNGLRIEIQYRTRVQHAWATAVEIADALDGARVKFDVGANPDRERLFLLISEVLARSYEGLSFIDIADKELHSEILRLDDKLGIFNRMRALKKGAAKIPASRNLVLEFGENLTIKGFRSYRQAMDYRNLREIESPSADVVFIRADNPTGIRSAFTNYFRNANEFLHLIRRE